MPKDPGLTVREKKKLKLEELKQIHTNTTQGKNGEKKVLCSAKAVMFSVHFVFSIPVVVSFTSSSLGEWTLELAAAIPFDVLPAPAGSGDLARQIPFQFSRFGRLFGECHRQFPVTRSP